MNATLNRPERVATETHVERQFVGTVLDGRLLAYTFSMCWEGTTLAKVEIHVRPSANDAEINGIGVSMLLRALSPAF